MTTADTLRERISRETSRGRPACNELILLDLLDWIESMEARVAQAEAARSPETCPGCTSRNEWATGAKV